MYIRITVSLIVVLCLMSPVLAEDASTQSALSMSKLMMSSMTMIIRPRPEMVIEQVGNQMQLTRDQRRKLLTILDNSEQAMQPLGRQYYESLEALRSVVYTPDKDGAKLREATEKATKAEAAFVSAEVDFWVQVRAVLTDTQLAQLQSVLSKPLPPVAQQPAPATPASTGASPNVPAASATPTDKQGEPKEPAQPNR